MIKPFDIQGPLPLREDLSLEASAGTGKTYSLERIVARLIMEEGLGIEEILVVTFTEKATKEMKSRIRQLLKSWSREDRSPREKERLQRALKNFDRGAIYTIHGFCSFLLKAFPLETAMPFEFSIENSEDVIRETLLDYISRQGDSFLPEDYEAFRKGYGDFEEMVSDWIRLLKNRTGLPGGYLIRPNQQDLSLYEQTLDDFNNQRGSLYKGWQRLVEERQEWSQWGSEKKWGRATTGKKRLDFVSQTLKPVETIEELLTLLMTGATKSVTLADILFSLSESSLDKTLKGWNAEDLQETQSISSLSVLLEELSPLLKQLYNPYRKKAMEPVYRAIRFYLSHAKTLEGILRSRKAYKGEVSYDDLINRIYDLLQSERSTALSKKVEERFRCCLIDEFQDTDQRQWAIFSHLFRSIGQNLILIGDPKQSIYGFRGANLQVYLGAVKKAHHRYQLGTNFRSVPSLVQGVNYLFDRLFGSDSPEENPLSFVPVTPSDKEHPRISGSSGGIHFIGIPKEEDKPLSKERFTSRIRDSFCREIANLLQGESLSVQGKERRVTPGDIAILVENHQEGDLFLDQLTNLGIPAVVSGTRDLFQSPAAGDLLDLLAALANPNQLAMVKKALLTPFCGFSLAQVQKAEDQGELEDILSLFDQWHKDTEHQGFYSVYLTISETFSYVPRQLDLVGGERHVTNAHHLVELLMDRQNRSFAGVGELHRFLMVQRYREQGEHSVRLDQDQNALQIVTMHASKGLEYPIVFFHGGYKAGPGGKETAASVVYNSPEGKVCDFLYGKEEKTRFNKEDWEERKRLYYVAFTRAVTRLYVPVGENCSKNYLTNMGASLDWPSIRAFLKQAGFPPYQPLTTTLKDQNQVFKQKPYDKASKCDPVINEMIWRAYQELCRTQPELFHMTIHDLQEPFDFVYRPQGQGAVLTGPRIYSGEEIPRGRLWVSSFSGLVHNAASPHRLQSQELPEEDVPEEMSPQEPSGFGCLPKGPDFGDVVHQILETIDFGAARDAADFASFWEGYGEAWFRENWLGKIRDVGAKDMPLLGEMVYITLTTPLAGPEGDWTLCGLSQEDRRAEVEFLLKVPQAGAVELDRSWTLQEGYLKGYIDLLIHHKDKVYILDWKTNYLGPSVDSYTPENLTLAMREHHYDLQYHIYGAAVARMLRWEKGLSFGGVYYLFLRGMEVPGRGVFFQQAREEDWQQFDPGQLLTGGVE